MKPITCLQAIEDENLFRPFLADRDDSLASWVNWRVALRCLYGLPIPEKRYDLVRQCTGRDPAKLPADGFDTALILTGRRSGKSKVAAIVGAFEAVLAGHEQKLSRGERGLVTISAPVKRQGRIVRDYLRAIFETPLLKAEVTDETKEGFELRSGVRIEIMAGDFRTVRGYTLLAAIVDEIAFFNIANEDGGSSIKSDNELIRALKPSLSTTSGRLCLIGSPYAKRGWNYRTYRKHFGNDAGRVLVWNCPSRTMNPLLPQRVVDDAMAEDSAAARSEYLGEFRDDVGEFLPRSVIENLIVQGRKELLPREGTRYVAFCDVSGGRGDDAALAIAHKLNRKVIIDKLVRYRPPFSPQHVIELMVKELHRFGLRKISGDNYAADFVAGGFKANGVHYVKAEKPKSALYLELLPRLCSGEVELLDDEVLINQLAGLERRTRSGGKDIIDHPPGSHDDLANAVAGVAVLAAAKPMKAGAISTD